MKAEEEATVDAAAEGNEWAADSATAAADWTVPVATTDGADAAAADKPEGRPRREREPEEEDNTLTLEQYLAQQKEKESAIPKLEGARQANEGADANIWKDVVPLQKEEGEAYFAGKVNHVPKIFTIGSDLISIAGQGRSQSSCQEGRKSLPRDRSTL